MTPPQLAAEATAMADVAPAPMADVAPVADVPADAAPAAAAHDPTEAAIDARIADARGNLTARLSELERRVEHVKDNLDPRTWVDSPWLRLGITVAIGYALGRSRMLRPIVKTMLGTAATAMVRRAIAGA